MAGLEDTLRTLRRPPALAVFDHITSNTGMVLPVEDMARTCRESGVVDVLIDGAHGPVQVGRQWLPS